MLGVTAARGVEARGESADVATHRGPRFGHQLRDGLWGPNSAAPAPPALPHVPQPQ